MHMCMFITVLFVRSCVAVVFIIVFKSLTLHASNFNRHTIVCRAYCLVDLAPQHRLSGELSQQHNLYVLLVLHVRKRCSTLSGYGQLVCRFVNVSISALSHLMK